MQSIAWYQKHNSLKRLHPEQYHLVIRPPGLNLTTTNLSLWNWRYPRHQHVNTHVDASNHPECLGVVSSVARESEDDGENDASQISNTAREPRDNSVRMGVNMGHKRKVGTISCLEEDGHQRDEAIERAKAPGIDLPNDDQQDARQHAAEVQPALLQPQVVARVVVQRVGNDAAHGPRGKIEKAKHGGPFGGARLAQRGEVGQVERGQDGVDGKLGAKGACIAEEHCPTLGGDDDF